MKNYLFFHFKPIILYKKGMTKKYDWILMILFLINLVFQLVEENYMASIAWICAILTLGRILLFENEKLP